MIVNFTKFFFAEFGTTFNKDCEEFAFLERMHKAGCYADLIEASGGNFIKVGHNFRFLFSMKSEDFLFIFMNKDGAKTLERAMKRKPEFTSQDLKFSRILNKFTVSKS